MKPHEPGNRSRWAKRWRKHCKGKHIRNRFWRKRYNRLSGHAKHWFWHD